jgi:hypothetical protein
MPESIERRKQALRVLGLEECTVCGHNIVPGFRAGFSRAGAQCFLMLWIVLMPDAKPAAVTCGLIATYISRAYSVLLRERFTACRIFSCSHCW